MYKMCDRCRFSVPAKQPLCHVCGSHDFVSEQAPSTKPIEAGLENCKATLGGALGAVQNAFLAMGREIGETAQKAQRATTSMRKLIFEAGPDHDQVLSFHRNIGSGRNVQFAPVFSSKSENAELDGRSFDSLSSPVAFGALSEALNLDAVAAKSMFLSDDNLFAPGQSFVEYMAAHSMISNEADVHTEQLKDERPELEDFSAMFKELLSKAPVLSIEAAPSAETQGTDVDSIRKNIGDLQGWFESYGKEGLLVKTELVIASPVSSMTTAEATNDLPDSAEPAVANSRQAA